MSTERQPQACAGIGRYLGHAYQARFSIVRRSYDWVVKLGGATLFRDVLPPDEEKRMYHGDVCVRCGDVVNAPAPISRTPAPAAQGAK